MIYGLDAWLFWLIVMIICLILEVISFNKTTIWFAAGSLAGLLLDLAGVSAWIQVPVMIVLSVALLLFYIYFLKPRFGRKSQEIVPTNADQLIGQDALVIESIDPTAGTGLVRSHGQVWSADSADGQLIPSGTLTTIVEIRGVKAVVKSGTDENNQPADTGEAATEEEKQ